MFVPNFFLTCYNYQLVWGYDVPYVKKTSEMLGLRSGERAILYLSLPSVNQIFLCESV